MGQSIQSTNDVVVYETSDHLGENREKIAFVIVLFVVLLALFLRGWNFFFLGLDHYDEGVYALSGFWSLHLQAGAALYPFQKLFSPPGYFGLIGLAYRLFGGASDSAAIGINIFFGAATAALAGWVGKRWFGWGCGLAATVLVALSDFNIAFSRTALTDTILTFLFLLSLAFVAISMELNRPLWALFAGLAAGAAWNVKYTGWLTVAITLVVVFIQAAMKQEASQSLKRMLLLCCLMAGVAFLLFLPWLVYTQMRLGGYLEVERFHGRFLNFHWVANFQKQFASQLYFDGMVSRLSPILAVLAALAVDGRRIWARWRLVVLVFVALVISVLLIGGIGTCIVLAGVGLRSAWQRGGMLGRLLVAAIAIQLILIPCYTAFARLALPWLLAVQIIAAAGIQSILKAVESTTRFGLNQETRHSGQLPWVLGLASLLVVAMAAGFSSVQADPWNSAPKDSVRRVVAQMANLVPSGSVVFVDDEPEAAFYFRQRGYATFCTMHLFNNSDVPDPFTYSTTAPVYLVVGVYAQLSTDWNPIPPQIRDRLQPLAKFLIQPGDVRLLDDFQPKEAMQYRLHPDDRYDLILLRVTPGSRSGI